MERQVKEIKYVNCSSTNGEYILCKCGFLAERKLFFKSSFCTDEGRFTTGKCPSCGLDVEEKQIYYKTNNKPIGDLLPLKERIKLLDNKTILKLVKSKLFGLRKYIKNNQRCYFNATCNSFDEECDNNFNAFESAFEYYAKLRNESAMLIMESKLVKSLWGANFTEVNNKFDSATRKYLKDILLELCHIFNIIDLYEERNYGKYFGYMEGHANYVLPKTTIYAHAHANEIDAFLSTLFGTDSRKDEKILISSKNYVEEMEKEEEIEESYNKELDDLVYGVDPIPDI